MYIKETREFRANIAEMLKLSEEEPVIINRGKKGMITICRVPLYMKQLSKPWNTFRIRAFRENLSDILDKASETIIFVQNSKKILFQVSPVPKEYERDILTSRTDAFGKVYNC